MLVAATLLGLTGGIASRKLSTSPGQLQARQRSTTGQPATPSSQPSTPKTLTGWDAVTAAVNPGIVNIVSLLPDGVGAGTGMVLTADGDVLTNNHVVEGAERIEGTVVGNGQTYTATLIGTDPSQDVALLRLEGAENLAPVPVGNSDDVEVGADVAAIGNAGGLGGEPIVATGSVVALHRAITASDPHGGSAQRLSDMIQVDADVQSGHSGGPLADSTGKVVGVTAAASVRNPRQRGTAREGYAIPINRAIDIANQLESRSGSGSGSGSGPSTTSPRAASRGFLGVRTKSSSFGALVDSVEANSPAQSAGLRAGDVIVAIDNSEVSSPQELSQVLQQHGPGDQVTVMWETSTGGQRQATVTLASR